MSTKMTEPQVIPVKPKVKPTPKREVKPIPRRGDPWTVPGPKKNPTPKAKNIKEMTKKKRLITTMGELDFCKTVLTKDEFNAGYEMSTELINKIVAKNAMANLCITDRVLSAEELNSLRF